MIPEGNPLLVVYVVSVCRGLGAVRRDFFSICRGLCVTTTTNINNHDNNNNNNNNTYYHDDIDNDNTTNNNSNM